MYFNVLQIIVIEIINCLTKYCHWLLKFYCFFNKIVYYENK